MRTTMIQLYEFKELSPEIQKVVIEREQRYAHEDYDSTRLTECFQQALEGTGYPTDKLRWSLSCSQGDGVAFYGRCDVTKLANRLLAPEEARVYLAGPDGAGIADVEITLSGENGRYHHWNSMTLDWEIPDEPLPIEWSQLHEKLLAAIRVDKASRSHELEAMGYDDINDVTSETYIRERLMEGDVHDNQDYYLYNGELWQGDITLPEPGIFITLTPIAGKTLVGELEALEHSLNIQLGNHDYIDSYTVHVTLPEVP